MTATLDVTDFDATDAPNVDVLDTTDLSALPEEAVEELRVRFRVDVDSQATWAMRKARAAALRVREVDRIAAAEIERIQEWALRERTRPERDLAFFTYLLEDYALRVRQADPRRKSVVTPYGKVQTRSQDDAVKVDDPDAFVKWAKENATELIKTTEAPTGIADIRAVVDVTDDGLVIFGDGELVPGLVVKPGGVTAKAEPDVTE
jgi:hypothetical protein